MLGEQGMAEYSTILGSDASKYKDILTPEQHKQIDEDLAMSTPNPEEAVLAQETIDTVEKSGIYGRKPPVLGEHARVSVLQGGLLQDLQKVYEYGVKNENGTQEQREVLKRFVESVAETVQPKYERHLQLTSGTGRVTKAEDGCTHMMTLTVPSAIADEIRWVYEQED